ncbi:MAG: transcription termination/antitermination NusG family protein [Verrucomicrobiota bacterium]
MKSAMEVAPSRSAELCPDADKAAWFCIRSQMKREHIAAAHLGQLPAVEVFNPQLRLLRSTRRGPKWFIESLFPNYLFARFTLDAMLEKVSGTPAVKFVVRFGDLVPEVPDYVIGELRRQLAEMSDVVLTDTPVEGEEVEIAAGAFAGMKATVTRVLPGRQRVQILLDILGRSVPAELGLESVLFNHRNGAQIALGRAGLLTAHPT